MDTQRARGILQFYYFAALPAAALGSVWTATGTWSTHPQPRVINTDLAPIYSSAIPDSKKEGTLRKRCRYRPVQYLNNILEQDHRAIKRRVNAKQGFRELSAVETCNTTPKRVPLCSCIECAVAPIPVKGQDERPPDALDIARRHSQRCAVQSRKAATSALTFMTFS
jgi:hypothetical protein